MKSIILLMSIFITIGAFAQDVAVGESRTLWELAEETGHPIEKLGGPLGLDISPSDYHKPLEQFGITVQRTNEAIAEYERAQSRFLWNIVATGMIIVFIALTVTGIIVALLGFFHRLGNRISRRKAEGTAESKAEKETVVAVSRRRRRRLTEGAGRSGAEEQPDWNTIVALATAIRLHESSIEESNRILVTWKKASVSMWKTNRVMPNQRFFNTRWRGK